MKVFLIIVAVLAVVISLVLSLSAEFTVIFDNGWSTKIKVLFIEKDIKLSKLLSFIVAPEKAAQDVSEELEKKKKQQKKDSAEKSKGTEKKDENTKKEPSDKESGKKSNNEKQAKPSYIKKILDEDGIAGLMLFISNLVETANSAVLTLIKGLHIYSLYVKMIIGGGDAADIAQKYGSMCGIYYPLKGLILTSMKVDQYDDFIVPDFIAPSSEYEFQLIGSINIALLLKIVFKAGKVFLVNLIKSK